VRKLIVLLWVAFVPALLNAQKLDAHSKVASIAPIVQRSTFLHGYLHGYEEGFHQGDLDLQLGRIERGDAAPNSTCKGYQKQFGSKQMFTAGFHQGFAVGYDDAADGRRFRAFDNVLRAAAGGSLKAATSGKYFDEGMQQGYAAGQHQGLADARAEAHAQPSTVCPLQTSNSAFCAAFASGFRLGYTDGYTNQAKTTLAEK
jgi:hypothetical protein